MNLDNLFLRIKEEFPKNAIEIKECLMLLSESIDSAMSDIQKASDAAYKDRNFDRIEELTQVARSVNGVQGNIDKYISDLELEDVKEEVEVIKQQEQEQQLENRKLPNYSDYIVDGNIPYGLYEDFTHKCPAAFSILGTKIEARQWKDVLLLTCQVLAKKDTQRFLGFAADPTMQGKKVNYFSKNTEKMRKPVKLDNTDVYIETNMSSNQIRNVIAKILRKYDVKITDYNVFLRADYTALHE
ncbi:hypothetical protein [Dehalobacter sp. CF]|jgi:hypothetical protein|uniref:hypothetical protein n=1 Tax=Dehalobacter sp. CF TaxID=1131462 RepID=UPI00028B9B9C|nr:hypothetical protein [Dehalobacter sp. CF]AFV05412.1 hypothetical protein DCF50_p1406 [Dehalobacter sp. CF]